MRLVMGFLLGGLLVASPALAQRVDRTGSPYYAWDLDGGFGFHNISHVDGSIPATGNYSDFWDYSWAGSVDVGRYWTSHIKTSVGVTLLQKTWEFESVRVSAAPGITGDQYIESQVARTQVSLAGTWQFLENAFVHPYVSAGLRTLVMDVDAEARPAVYVRTGNGYTNYQVPTSRRDYQVVRTRPFVAIGSKSYFSERVYVRPEMVVGANDSGVSQFGARLSFGIDF